MTEESWPLTTFVTLWGLYELICIPFDLMKASSDEWKNVCKGSGMKIVLHSLMIHLCLVSALPIILKMSEQCYSD